MAKGKVTSAGQLLAMTPKARESFLSRNIGFISRVARLAGRNHGSISRMLKPQTLTPDVVEAIDKALEEINTPQAA